MPAERLIRYGEPIDATDIARYPGREPALWFTTLVRLLIQAELGREQITYIVPQVTNHIAVGDGGVDASLEIGPLELPAGRDAGLINRGRTVYQFKWRTDPRRAVSDAAGELKKLEDQPELPDVYVYATNVDLSRAHKRRVRMLLREDCQHFPADRIVILGAAELQDRVNMDPRIRVAHFGGIGFCTWEKASEAGERRYGTKTTPPFCGRESERGAIRRFVNDPDRRVLVLHGPHGVGKTRVALEALADMRDRVVWAPDVPAQPASLIQVLDDSANLAVLIVDATADPDPLIARALEAAHLKTIVLAPHSTPVPGAVELPIRPFDQPTATAFMQAALPGVSFARLQWLYDQLGGSPGSLLQGAAALESLGDRAPLDDGTFNAILEAHERAMIAPIGRAINTLEVLSLAPTVPLPYGEITKDVELLCGALDADPRRIRGDLEVLRARNLVEFIDWRTHEVWRVIPPLLARRRARNLLFRIGDGLPNLIRALSEEGRAGLVRRVGEWKDEPALRAVVDWFFADAGFFANVGSLIAHSRCVVALAETVPARTVTAIVRVLQSADVDARRAALAHDAGWPLVHALTGLAHQRDTFEDAARALFLLAEGEEERGRVGARRAFNSLFHWQHPELSTSAPMRVHFLESLCEATTPAQRMVITAAAGEGLNPYFSVSVWQGDPAAPPERVWWPATWGPLQQAVRRLVALLRRHSGDEDLRVRETAQRELARGMLATGNAGIPEEGITVLEFLAGQQLTPRVASVVAESAAGFINMLRSAARAATAAEPKELLERLADRGSALFDQITAADFPARFHHWLGPSPMRAHREVHGAAAWEEMRHHAERLAQEAVDNPAVLTSDLLEWAVGEDAPNAGLFLWALGRLDLRGQWLGPLEAFVPRMRIGGGLSTYVAGWAERDPAAASRYLDEIAPRGENWSLAAADATWRLASGSENAARLLRCVREGRLHPKHVTRQLRYAGWSTGLALDDLLTLVTGLRDGSEEVDWPLIEVFETRWSGRHEEWDRLGPVAIQVLTGTAKTDPHQHTGSDWDALAAQVARWDADAGFGLLLIHLRDGARGPVLFLHHDRSQLLHVLSEIDRPRLVRELVAAASRGPRAFDIQYELPLLLRPATDTPTLVQLINGAGVETARLIAGHLDASQDGFTRAFEELAARWGGDQDVRAGLIHSVVSIREPFSDMAAILEPRIPMMNELTTHPDARVVAIAAEAARRLREAIVRNGR